MAIITSEQLYTRPAPELYKQGEIQGFHAIDPSSVGIDPDNHPALVWSLEIADPYVDSYSASERFGVISSENAADATARLRRILGKWQRKPGTAYYDENGDEQDKQEWGDPSLTKGFFNALGSEALADWRELVPTASALRYLSDPTMNTLTDRAGEVHPIDDTAHKWMSLSTDAVGIRARGTVLSELVKAYVQDHDLGENVNWMSVACGTALPTIQGALAAGIDHKTSLLLVDPDKNAMSSTVEIADELGFQGEIQQERMNVFKPEKVADLKERLIAEGKRPKLVDIMGILEYTGENLGVDSVEFLKMYYDILEPGGRLLLGQMREDRPRLDFTMGVVGWPYVQTRTINDLMGLLKEAGIPLDKAQVYLPKDGVYTVCCVDKPHDSEMLTAAI